MNSNVKKVVGVILFISIISGLTCCEDNYKLNHTSKTGNIIEQTVEDVDYDSVFTPVENTINRK